MGSIPCYLQSQIVSACRTFRPVAPLFFLEKVLFLAFLKIQKGVWPYRYAHDVPLVTLILTIWVRGSNLNCSNVN